MGEVWATIPWYDGFTVSTLGRVKRGSELLKPQKGGRHVSLWWPSKGIRITSISIGALVLLAFRGPPPPNSPFALHSDDDCSNNELSNLRWGSNADNTEDKIKNGGTTKGVPPSAGARLAISKKLKGRKLSEATKLKMSEAKKGKPLSAEHKAALSAASRGKPKSLAHREALSIASSKWWEQHK